MADLTATLPDVQPDTRVIPSSAGTPSVLGGIAEAAGSALSAFTTRKNNADTLMKFNEGQSDRSAENKVATGYLGPGGIFQQANAGAGVPASVIQQANGVKTIQAGVQAGNVPAATLTMQIQALVQTTLRDYPQSAGAIMAYLKTQGIEHPLVDAMDQSFKDADAVQDNIRAGNKIMSDYAYNKGLVDPSLNLSQDQTIAIGQKALFQQAQLEDMKAASEQQSAMDKHELDALEIHAAGAKAAAATAGQTVLSISDQAMSSTITSFIGQVAAAKGPDQVQDILTSVGPQVTATIEAGRQQALSLLAQSGNDTTESEAAVNGKWDSYKKSIDSVLTGDGSQVGLNVKALQNLQATYGLSGAGAAIMYTRAAAIFGKEAINTQMMGGPNAPGPLSADMLAGLTKEAHQLDLAPDANSWNAGLLVFDQIAKGQLTYKQLTPVQAAQQMPMLLGTVRVNAATAAAGNPESQRVWTNSYAAVVQAVDTLQPGNKDIGQISRASSAVVMPEAPTIINNLIKNPATAEQGKTYARASASASARIITVVQHAGVTDASGAVSLQVGADGLYHPVLDQGVAQRIMANQPVPNLAGERTNPNLDTGARPTAAQIFATGSAQLKQRQDILNANINNAYTMEQFSGDQAPTTPAKGRASILSGGISAPGKAGSPVPTTDKAASDWWANENKLNATLKGFTADQAGGGTTNIRTAPGAREMTFGPVVDAAAKANGVPTAAARIIIGQESSFDPNADVRVSKPPGWEKSHAAGLTQMQPGLAAKMGLRVPGYDPKTGHYEGGPGGSPLPGDERMDPAKSADAGLKYFAGLVYSNGGDVRAAAHQYSGGQWPKSMVDRLIAAYHVDHQGLLAQAPGNPNAS